MIIAISGVPGSGKTTAAKKIAKKLGYKLISTGEEFEKTARKELLKAGKISPKEEKNKVINIIRTDKKIVRIIDKALDEKVKKEASKGNVIVEGRLSAYNVPRADVKFFVTASIKARARRVSQRDKISVEQAEQRIQRRQKLEEKAWKKTYKYEYTDLSHYDHVISDDYLDIKQTAEVIYHIIKETEKTLKKGKKKKIRKR